MSLASNQPRSSTLIASLTVSAGALAAGSAAHASIVAITLDHDVGVIGGVGTAPYFVALGGFTRALAFYAFEGTTNTLSFIYSSNVYLRVKQNLLPRPIGGIFPQIVSGTAGQKWSDLTAFDAISSYGSLLQQNATTGVEYGPFPSGLQYYAFEFKDSTGQLNYGWFSASLHDTGPGNAWAHLGQVAYEISGAEIAIGATTDVPEPTSLGLLALGAMMTGAAGTRRFKRRRAAD